MKVLGVSGWSGCGKTTLIVALIPRLRARGVSGSTLKHAHHVLAIGRRWVLLHELREEPEPLLAALLARLQPVDLVLVEGWKTGDYPKLEIWRPVVEDRPPRFPHDSTIVAVASEPLLDPAAYGRPGLPAFPLADLEGIAGFVAEFARQTRYGSLVLPCRSK